MTSYEPANRWITASVAASSSLSRLAITVLATSRNFEIRYVQEPPSVNHANRGVGEGAGVEVAIIAPIPIIEPVMIRVLIANFT